MARKNWIRRFTHATASALALTVLVPSSATAQDTNKLEEVDDTAATEKALFAIFPDLDTAKTRETLAALRKDSKRSAILAKLTTALSQPNTKPVDIEADVLDLIRGQKVDQAELTLNAVMRDYYDHYVVGSTGNKSLAAVTVGLEQTDNTLTMAAYGSTPRSRKIKRVRMVRR